MTEQDRNQMLIEPGVGEPMDEEQKEWSPWDGLLALVLALGASFTAAVIIMAALSIAGVSDPGDSAGFTFSATLAQEAAFIAGALFVALQSGRISASKFGLNGFKFSAVGWAVLAFIAYIAIAAAYAVIVEPPKDELPKSFGVDDSTFLAVATGVLVVGIAPFVEEFFFRGFLYKAMTNGIGVWPGALASGALFGLIHLKPIYFAPLMALGVILALLYQRTGSIWPCIGVHAANNAIAFAVMVS